LFEVLESELSINLNYRSLPPRSSDQRVFIADISKAQKLLGWQPKVGYRDGIRSMLEWVKDHVAI
jgi:CDP-paratose 2-epimerase